MSASKIGEHDKAILGIALNPQRQLGPVKYSTFIPANDVSGGRMVTVKGVVEGPIGVAYPPQLYFGRVESGQSASRTLLYFIRRPDVEVLHVTSDSPYVRCSFKKVTSSAFEIALVLSPMSHSSLVQGTITIETNDRDRTEVHVPFSGVVGV